VPVSKLAELVEVSKDILHKHELKGYVYGHAGQGNLHVRIFRDEDDSKQWDAAEAANEAIVNYGLSVGGTATGEHGVGIGKKKFMAQEHGASLDVMRQLKQTLDPIGIMNPGKKL
jgi:D-lactate dehydrogenase (cytochrome)